MTVIWQINRDFFSIIKSHGFIGGILHFHTPVTSTSHFHTKATRLGLKNPSVPHNLSLLHVTLKRHIDMSLRQKALQFFLSCKEVAGFFGFFEMWKWRVEVTSVWKSGILPGNSAFDVRDDQIFPKFQNGGWQTNRFLKFYRMLAGKGFTYCQYDLLSSVTTWLRWISCTNFKKFLCLKFNNVIW